MKFKDMPYVRPDIDNYISVQTKLIEKINSCLSKDEIKTLIDEYKKNETDLNTTFELANVRHTINTLDEFYNNEFNYLIEISPKVESISNTFNKTLLNHKLINDIEDIYGKYYLDKLNIEEKCFNDSISDLLIEEQKLVDMYDTIIAGAKIEFEGKTYNLSQMAKFSHNLDRNIRENAAIAVDKFMESNDEKIGDIYSKLIKVRNEMAHKLGFESAIELYYSKMQRLDYDKNLVAKFREEIKNNIVPIASKLFKEQAKRININDPKMYDYSLSYLDGNPMPKGNKDELIDKALKMYSQMSKETKEFFTLMIDNELMDLETKPGKMSGGYMTHFAKYKVPFIFSNFNGTSDDVNVLTHEAGHAFMYYYASKFIDNESLIFPTMETCEIHSTAMEFFAYPYLNSFFLDDTNKYKHMHMSDSITFLPYACCVDEFQHIAYSNPNFTLKDLKKAWQDLEKKYLPWRDYGKCSFTTTGTFWYKQGHIFANPFYYIDYALATICALSFYLADIKDHQDAYCRYLKLCSLGGTMPFLSLLSACNIPNPFAKDTIKNITSSLLPIIKNIDYRSNYDK